jgi:hypothetical protein
MMEALTTKVPPAYFSDPHPWLSEFVVGRAIVNRTGPPVSSGLVNVADRVLGCRRGRSGRVSHEEPYALTTAASFR